MCAVALSCCAASSSSLDRRLKRSPASMTISRRTVEHVFGTRKGIVNLPIQDRIPALKVKIDDHPTIIWAQFRELHRMPFRNNQDMTTPEWVNIHQG